jgi:hypothetical protein
VLGEISANGVCASLVPISFNLLVSVLLLSSDDRLRPGDGAEREFEYVEMLRSVTLVLLDVRMGSAGLDLVAD